MQCTFPEHDMCLPNEGVNEVTEKEIQAIMLNMGDKRLVDELDIGCNNSFEQGYARCPYNDGHCIKGACLTSTMLGAYPNDCPLRKGEQDDKR